MEPIVRRMQPEELPRVFDVWQRSQAELLARFRPDQLHPVDEARQWFYEVLAPSCEIWVVECDGRVRGMMAMDGSEIERLYIDPDDQGRDLGAVLVDKAKRLCPDGLRLVTHQINTGARRFYERHDFEAYEFGRSPAPEDEPDVRYRWPPRARGAAGRKVLETRWFLLGRVLAHYAKRATFPLQCKQNTKL